MRVDLVFSYWVAVWYLLYIGKMTTYSPKLMLFLGLCVNVAMLGAMLWYGTAWSGILSFVLVNLVLKVYPLYTLRTEPLRWREVYPSIAVFAIFGVWLHLHHTSLADNQREIYLSLLHGQHKTPFLQLIHRYFAGKNL